MYQWAVTLGGLRTVDYVNSLYRQTQSSTWFYPMALLSTSAASNVYKTSRLLLLIILYYYQHYYIIIILISNSSTVNLCSLECLFYYYYHYSFSSIYLASSAELSTPASRARHTVTKINFFYHYKLKNGTFIPLSAEEKEER